MYQVPDNFSFRIQSDEQRNKLNALATELQTERHFQNAREFTFAVVDKLRELQSCPSSMEFADACSLLEDECKQLKLNCIQLEDENRSLKERCIELADLLNVYKQEFDIEFKAVNALPTADVNTDADTHKVKTADVADGPTDESADVNTPPADSIPSSLANRQKLYDAIGYESIPTDEQFFADLLEIITSEDDPTGSADDQPANPLFPPTPVLRDPADNEVFIELTPVQSEMLEKIVRFRVKKGEDQTRLTKAQAIKKMVFNRGTLMNEHGYFKTFINGSRMK